MELAQKKHEQKSDYPSKQAIKYLVDLLSNQLKKHRKKGRYLPCTVLGLKKSICFICHVAVFRFKFKELSKKGLRLMLW